MRLRRGISLVCMCLALLCGSIARAEDTPQEAAQKADLTWLSLVDSGQYAQSWQTASAAFRAAVSKPQWEQALKSVRAPLGKLNKRVLQRATATTSLPGAPDGSYVVATFNSSFEHKDAAIETVVATLDKDGSWRISGYFIK